MQLCCDCISSSLSCTISGNAVFDGRYNQRHIPISHSHPKHEQPMLLSMLEWIRVCFLSLPSQHLAHLTLPRRSTIFQSKTNFTLTIQPHIECRLTRTSNIRNKVKFLVISCNTHHHNNWRTTHISLGMA